MIPLFLYRMFYFSILAFLIGITAPALIPVLGLFGFLIFYILVFATCITVHEVGHFIFAFFAQLRVSMFSVGLLRLVRLKNRWVVRSNKNLLLGGFTLAAPLDDENLDKRLALWTLGGPLLGFIYGFVSILVYIWLSPGLVEPAGILSNNQFTILQAWLIANFAFSVMISLHSLMPEQNWSSTSDGYKLLQYWRKGEDAVSIKFLYLLSGSAQAGIRPRYWHLDYIDYLQNAPGPPNRRMQAFLLHYLYSLDKGLVEQAGRSLDQALLLSKGEKLPSAGLYWEAAYYTARHHNQPELGREWMKRAQPGFLDEEQTRFRAEAAILSAEGHYQQALTLVEKGLEKVDSSIEPGTALAEREWLEDLRAIIVKNTSADFDPSSPQAQIRRLEENSSSFHEIQRPVLAPELKDQKLFFLKKSISQIFHPANWLRFLVLRLLPILIFSIILAVLYYWLSPPACAPKILENFSCKTQYYLATFRGLNAERQGFFAEANLAFATALEAHPEGAFARRMRADLNSSIGNYQQAYDDYAFLRTQNPGDVSLLLSMADVLMKKGKSSDAIDAAISAVAIGGEDVVADGLSLLEKIYKEVVTQEGFLDDLNSDKDSFSLSEMDQCKLGLAYAYQENWLMVEKILEEFFPTGELDLTWCRKEILNLSLNR